MYDRRNSGGTVIRNKGPISIGLTAFLGYRRLYIHKQLYSVSHIPGWSGEQNDGVLAKWRSTNEMVTASINFPIATGRLEDRREEKEESDDSDNEQQQFGWISQRESEG